MINDWHWLFFYNHLIFVLFVTILVIILLLLLIRYDKFTKHHNLLKLLVFILLTIKADNQWCYLLCIFILALHWNFITENIFEIIERLLFAYFQDCKIAKILGCVAILNFSKCIIVKNKIIFAFSKTAKIKINFKTANF